MAREQIKDVATGGGAFIGITGAERDDVTDEIGANGCAAEQFNDGAPRLAKLAQQAVDPAACRLGFVRIVSSESAEELSELLAFLSSKRR